MPSDYKKTHKKITSLNACYSPGDESVWLAGGTHGLRHYFMVGKVMKISIGDKFDIVTVNTSLVKKDCLKSIIVYENHARRQLNTLKKGQRLISSGLSGINIEPRTINGKEVKVFKRYYYADMIQGMYVPKSYDVKRDEEWLNTETDKMTEEHRNMWQSAVDDVLDSKEERKPTQVWEAKDYSI